MKIVSLYLAVGMIIFLNLEVSSQEVRIKDVVEVKGAVTNKLKGVGLVVGLNGTGDSPKALTLKMLKSLMKRVDNIEVDAKELQSKNVAVVMVTADLPPFQGVGTWIDINVSSLGDAKSLKGGTLLVTPLRSPRAVDSSDPESFRVYAIAQGSISTGGEATHLTSATITNGALVTSSVPLDFVYEDPSGKKYCKLLLRNPDFNLAERIASSINSVPDYKEALGEDFIARAIDGGTVKVFIPEAYTKGKSDQTPATFVAEILKITIPGISQVEDKEATVVINERTRTITVTGNVIVSPTRIYKTGVYNLEITEDKTLSDVLKDLGNLKLTPEQIIDIIIGLQQSKAIRGKVIIQ